MADPIFPSLHIRPPTGWVNDPNGICRVDGTYHVFFQWNPAAPVHEVICWGHASSVDLIRWQDEPVALVPRTGQLDAAGCWSGCLVDDAGVPTAIYTANPGHAADATTALAFGDRRLRDWRQDDRPVVEAMAEPGFEMRDPFVFTFDAHRYAVLGAGDGGGRPQVRLYGCEDLRQWTDLGPLITGDDPLAAEIAPANIWECPNLFPLAGEWVLVVSLWSRVEGGHLLAGVRHLVGDLVPTDRGPRFTARSGGLVDRGDAFYAPHVLVEEHRVLLWGWSWEVGRSDEQVAEADWAGLLTFPREAYRAESGVVGWRPAAELTGLRTGVVGWTPGEPFAAGAFEVETDSAWRLGPTEGGRVLSGPGPARILVDHSIVEVFEDPVPLTTRVYPEPGTRWVLWADPEATAVHRLSLG